MPINEGLFPTQDQAEEDLKGARGWTIDDEKPSTFDGIWMAPARGLGQGVANGVTVLSKGLEFRQPWPTPEMVQDTYGMEHGEKAARPLDPWQKDFNEFLEQEQQQDRDAAKRLTPDPRVTGSAANLVQGFTRAATEYGLGAVTAGPLGGAATVGASEGYARYLDLKDQGVDDDTARRSAILTGITNSAGAIAPFSLPANLVSKIALPELLTQASAGAAINMSFGAASRAGDAKILRDAGYTAMADQMEPWDKWNLATDAIMGAFFGAHSALTGHVDPSIRDAAKVVQDRQETINRAPGVPVDLKSQAVHRQSLESALGDLLQDHPVSLDADKVEGAAFARPAQTPDVASKIIFDEFKKSGVFEEADDFDQWLKEEVFEPKKEPPIVGFRRNATDIVNSLPNPEDGMTRLWRGNRPREEGANPSFTNDLPGIALPFKKQYGGFLTYVDIPTGDLPKYSAGSGGTDAEFSLPPNLAKQAKVVPESRRTGEVLTPEGVAAREKAAREQLEAAGPEPKPEEREAAIAESRKGFEETPALKERYGEALPERAQTLAERPFIQADEARKAAEGELAKVEADKETMAKAADPAAAAIAERPDMELAEGQKASDALEIARTQEAEVNKEADIAFGAAADCGARHA